MKTTLFVAALFLLALSACGQRHEATYRVAQFPASDEPLKKWFEAQAGNRGVEISREGNALQVRYYSDKLIYHTPPFGELGYGAPEGATITSQKFQKFPLLPTLLIAAAATTAAIAALILGLWWSRRRSGAAAENKDGDGAFKRSVWWKIYFFLTALAHLLYPYLLADPAAGLTDYIDAALSLIALVGLFGFVFVRPIYEPRFWLSVLVVWVVWTLFLYPALSDYKTDLMKDYSGIESIFFSATEWLIMLPWLYALYLYGKPCNPAWQKNLKTLQ